MGRLAQLLQRLRVIQTRSIERVVNVATTATVILPNDPDRIAYLIVNNTVNRCFVEFSAQVSTTRGIPLEPNGGQLQLLVDEDGERVGKELWGLMQTAAGNIFVVEERAV